MGLGGASLRLALALAVVAEAQQPKAKLMLKGKWRPEKMVRARRCRTAPA